MAIICNIKNIFKEEATNIVENENLDNDQTEQLPTRVGNLSIPTDEVGVPENINQPDSAPPSSLPEKVDVASSRPNAKTQGQQRRNLDPSTWVLHINYDDWMLTYLAQ